MCLLQCPAFVSVLPGNNSPVSYTHLAKITCGDLLWLVHPVPGVALFDLKTQRLSFIEGKDEQGRPLNTESDFFAFEDRNDILWVHPKGCLLYTSRCV